MAKDIIQSEKERMCTKCKRRKPLSEFFLDKRWGKYQNICLECYREYHRDYYERRKNKNANIIAYPNPNAVKTCIRCNQEKPITEFSFDKATGKVINTCKACKVEIAREHYKENKEKILAYASKYQEQHKEKINEYQKAYRAENAEKRRAYSREYEKEHYEEIRIKRRIYRQKHIEEFRKRDKEYAETHKEQISERYRQWAKEHAEQLAAYNKKYRENNAEIIAKKRQIYDRKNRPRIREYINKKRTTDPLFKLSTQVRSLIYRSLVNRGYGKKTHTYEILGCDYETLWEHLKRTWLNNYGSEWDGEDFHIDHIIPLATAKNEKEVLELCYYKNLQMLKPKDNLVKNKSTDWKIRKIK